MNKLLNGRKVYEVLKKDPTARYKRKFVSILLEWEKDKRISSYIYRRIYPTSEKIPKFYGLPKVHKKETPLRHTVSSIGSITYPAAKFLSSVLNPIKGKAPHSIKISEDFVQKIRDLEVPPELVSYDVSALFTSLPVEDAITLIRRRLEEDDTLSTRCELDGDQMTTILRSRNNLLCV